MCFSTQGNRTSVIAKKKQKQLTIDVPNDIEKVCHSVLGLCTFIGACM